MNKNDKIYIAGHNGLVGSSILKIFKAEGFNNIICRNHRELDLINTAQTEEFFRQERPDYVILSAAKVGGIKANMTHQADFLYQNLMIQNNVITSSYKAGVKKLCFLGSSCIYPRECPQPIKEEYLLTGPLEPTNEGYALAKLSGYKLCLFYKQQYGMNSVSLMPCNIYGPNDHFDLENSHVLSALVKRFCDAARDNVPEITLWGTGVARREFLHSDDLGRAVFHFMQNRDSADFVNVGPGTDISIKELASMIVNKTGYKGVVKWDAKNPDGMPRKCLDVSRMKAGGFEPKISLEEGVAQMIEIYRTGRVRD